MIERAYIHVTGPAQVGKTECITRLLESNRSKLLLVARCINNDRLKRPKTGNTSNRSELERYRQAGAHNVTAFLFPLSSMDSDPFFETDFIQDYSSGVVLEGDSPLRFPPDLTVYVAPAITEGEQLLSQKRVPDKDMRDLEQIEAFFAELGGGKAVRENTTLVSLLEAAKRRRRKGGKGTTCWTLAKRYQGIEYAQAVVINIRDECERPRAETMLEDLARLRKDKEIFRDVASFRGDRRAITAVIANLKNPKDPGTRKLLARIKRVF